MRPPGDGSHARGAPRPATGRQDRHAAPGPREVAPSPSGIDPESEPVVPGTGVPRGAEYYQRERAHPKALGCLLAALACCAVGFALLLVLALLPPGESIPMMPLDDEAPIEDEDEESLFAPFAPTAE